MSHVRVFSFATLRLKCHALAVMKRWAAFGILGFLGFAYFIGCKDQVDPEFPKLTEEPNDTLPEDQDRLPTDGGQPAKDASKEAEAAAPLTGECADTFGDKLTNGFGRIDGIIYAVQKPSDTQCTEPNDDHVVVQVLMGGAVYRLVVNVQSNRPLADGAPPPPVHMAVVQHALPEPAFKEGWHTGVSLDYVTTLGVRSDDEAFKPGTMDELVEGIASQLKVGAKISVYASSRDKPSSAHLVHRNKPGKDGAIVVSPATSKPKFLLFRFGDQVFPAPPP